MLNITIVCKTCGNREEALFNTTDSGLVCKCCGTLYHDAEAESYYISGNDYYNGANGKEKDYKKAFEFFEKAARRGNAEAQIMLGNCYYNGEGVEKNFNQAVNWYEKAADQGLAQAKCELGKCYSHGNGIEKDLHKAWELYTEAAEKGDMDAQLVLAKEYSKCTTNNPMDFVKKDRGKAEYWYAKVAEQGNGYLQLRIAEKYYYGIEINKDLKKAVYLFTKAAEQGNDEAKYMLGECYYYGKGVEKDYAKAAEWFTKVDQLEFFYKKSDARYMLGNCYYYQSSMQDYAKAAEWYEKASELVNSDAQYRLATLYEEGKGVEKDPEKAKEWYTRAALHGSKEAKEALEAMDEPEVTLANDNFFARNFFGICAIAMLSLLLFLFDGGKLGKALYAITPFGMGEATGIANFGFATATFTVCTVIIYFIILFFIKHSFHDGEKFGFVERILNFIACIGIWYAGYGLSRLLVKITWGFRFFTVIVAIIVTLIFIVAALFIIGIIGAFTYYITYGKSNVQKWFIEISRKLNVKFIVSLILFHIGLSFTIYANSTDEVSNSFVPLILLIGGAIFSIYYAIKRIFHFQRFYREHVTNKNRWKIRRSEGFLLFVVLVAYAVFLSKYGFTLTLTNMLISPCFITLPFVIISRFFAIIALKPRKAIPEYAE